jgi:hypothetical protein
VERVGAWRDHQGTAGTGERPEWFLRLAGDDNLAAEMVKAPRLDSEVTGSDAKVVGGGMVAAFKAAEFKAVKFKARRETSGSAAADPKASSSRPDNTGPEEHLPARPRPWPHEVATGEPGEDNPDTVLGEHTRELEENSKASEEKDAAKLLSSDAAATNRGPATDEAIPASWAVATDSVNVMFERVSTRHVRAVAALTIAEVVFSDEDFAQHRSAGDQPFASRHGN